MDLLEILNKNKAVINIPLPDEVASQYNEYHCMLDFSENKITIRVFDDEGGIYGYDYDEPLPFEWVEAITKFVNELKDAKAIPDYTLDLKLNGQ